ncbi:MAG: DNA methylase, partial [Armatimonadetes bacterium]|nr:DNA methylase [Armatimonadota bacterium]
MSRGEANGEIDPRNQLNELSNREWLKRTKSVWYSNPGPRDPLKQQHPATFAEADVVKLIELFTRSHQLVLDPFLGTGSTLIAAMMAMRRGLGVELVEHWAEIARARVEAFIKGHGQEFRKLVDPERDIICGDSRVVLPAFSSESVDFIVTSPPYWSILRNADGMKTAFERSGLPTCYSERPDDLGNVPSYERFIGQLRAVWEQCHRILKAGKYMAVVVSDFRHGPR